MPGLTAAAAGSAWSYGGSILTFVFPMLLFLIVAAVLWVLFTKPQVTPGHRDQVTTRPVGATWLIRPAGPAEGGQAPAAEGGRADTAEGEAGS